jgi:hypothetical protein
MKNLIFVIASIISTISFAATISISDPNCASFASTDSGGNVTISCGTQPPPVAPPVVPPPPVAPPSLTCDTSQTRIQANGQTSYVGAGQAAAFSFTPTTSGRVTIQNGSEALTWTISQTACDFKPDARCIQYGSPNTLTFSPNIPMYCPITPGATYYVNVRGGMPDGNGGWTPACASGACAFMLY